MKRFKELSVEEMRQVKGGKYYGNGVYCNKEKCWVDWNKAQGEIGKIIVNGWVNHGPWAPRP